jgi:hypothetical protein
MVVVLLMFKVMMVRIPSAGAVACMLAFLALCKGGFRVSALCALQCAKNSVGSGRQGHG